MQTSCYVGEVASSSVCPGILHSTYLRTMLLALRHFADYKSSGRVPDLEHNVH